VWEPSRPHKRRFFWLGLERDVRVEGAIEGNTVTVTSESETGPMTVYLNDSLVDPAKPVKVVRNGETAFEGPVPARLSVLLDGLVGGGDPGQVYDRAIALP
jgi:hypothetical protein